jgi:hypothetical protein
VRKLVHPRKAEQVAEVADRFVRIGIAEYEGVVRVPWSVFQHLLAKTPTLERCLEAYYLHRTRLEFVPSGRLGGG